MTKCLQENPESKAKWLADTSQRLPPNSRVRVIGGDVEKYLGATGFVTGYDIGGDGDWPLVSVAFDKPIVADGGEVSRDGFYYDGFDDYDEIQRIA